MSWAQRILEKIKLMDVPKSSSNTAISRGGELSAPIKALMKKGFIKKGERVLDFGCGKGEDADKLGFAKFDPKTFPKDPGSGFKKIVSNFVLNTLSKEKQDPIIKQIKSLLAPGGQAFITVRRDLDKEGTTSKGTFQRNVTLDAESVIKNAGFETFRITK